jgi:hypothetical protein
MRMMLLLLLSTTAVVDSIDCDITCDVYIHQRRGHGSEICWCSLSSAGDHKQIPSVRGNALDDPAPQPLCTPPTPDWCDDSSTYDFPVYADCGSTGIFNGICRRRDDHLLGKFIPDDCEFLDDVLIDCVLPPRSTNTRLITRVDDFLTVLFIYLLRIAFFFMSMGVVLIVLGFVVG